MQNVKLNLIRSSLLALLIYAHPAHSSICDISLIVTPGYNAVVECIKEIKSRIGYIDLLEQNISLLRMELGYLKEDKAYYEMDINKLKRSVFILEMEVALLRSVRNKPANPKK